MIGKTIILLFAIAILKSQCQDIAVPETDNARLFMASFRALNATHAFLFCGS